MNGSKRTTATKDQIIRDAQRIALKTDLLTRDFLRQHSLYSDRQRSKFFPNHTALLKAAGLETNAVEATPAEQLAIKQVELANKNEGHKKVLDEAVKKISALERENAAILNLRDRTPQLFDIPVQTPSGNSESVLFTLASDWHSEEEVLPGQVGGLNQHNLEIGEQRANNYWRGVQRFYDIFKRDTSIPTIVVGAIGDFITNSIHEDGAESNLLPPSDAIYRVQNMLLSGLRFLLKNTTANILVVCHSGNHGRTTKEQRIATETGNSLEQYMFYNMRDILSAEKRITFQIAEGYHSYVRLFDGKYTVRFHHGHGMNFGGGVGGLTIPVNKAISQWNKGVKADLDAFGHFHTKIDANNFVSNGSLIGYNAYALRIKADYEPPSQSLFLVNRKYNAKGVYTPIFV
jgi:hypothetical protein